MNIALIGGSGFIGQVLAQLLVAQGHTVHVLTRDVTKAKNQLLVLPTCHVRAYTASSNTLTRALEGMDVVVNLVGILHETRRDTFVAVHEEFVRTLLVIIRQLEIKHYIHISAIGATPGAPSYYLRSKSKAEQLTRDEIERYTIIRPSIVFGEQDKSINMFAGLVDKLPLIFVPCGIAKAQPVYVKDLARLIALAMDDRDCWNQTLHAAGPRQYSLAEIMHLIADAKQKKRKIASLGTGFSMIFASLMELLPGKIITRDNVRSLSMDNTVKDDNNAVVGLLDDPTDLESYINDTFAANREFDYSFSHLRHRSRR